MFDPTGTYRRRYPDVCTNLRRCSDGKLVMTEVDDEGYVYTKPDKDETESTVPRLPDDFRPKGPILRPSLLKPDITSAKEVVKADDAVKKEAEETPTSSRSYVNNSGDGVGKSNLAFYESDPDDDDDRVESSTDFAVEAEKFQKLRNRMKRRSREDSGNEESSDDNKDDDDDDDYDDSDNDVLAKPQSYADAAKKLVNTSTRSAKESVTPLFNVG